jgi:DNA-binding winged helix-turn-helix (wHTH) protein
MASWIDTGFVLANWEVRPRHGTVMRRDQSPPESIRVEPRVMAVLTCLARHLDEVVTRDEFSAEVWGGRVVSDEALSRCISVLRQIFGDDSREPRFIRTIARIGYTLVPTPAPLTPCDGIAADRSMPQTNSAPAMTTESSGAIVAPPPGNRWPARLWLQAKLASWYCLSTLVGPAATADKLASSLQTKSATPCRMYRG